MAEKIPDAQGAIAKVRTRLARNCSVRLSQYCDHIIALRMQGTPFYAITKWLKEKGEEHSIPPSTIWRNLKGANIDTKLTYAEEMAEKWGGSIDIDLQREIAAQIIVQKKRIDTMVRNELTRRKANDTYVDRRIRMEMETMGSMVKSLHAMIHQVVPEGDSSKEKLTRAWGLTMSEDAQAVLTQMILSGELILKGEPKEEEDAEPPIKH